MVSTPHDGSRPCLPPSMLRPALDRVSSQPIAVRDGIGRDQNVLATFDSRVRPWGGVPVPLNPASTCALWIVFALDLAYGGWLLAVRSGVAPCSGLLCTVATLGDHPVPALVLSLACGAALAGAMPVTRGLSRAGAPQLAVIVVGALCGLIALSGVAVLLVGGALCLVVAGGVLVLVADRL